MQLLTSDQLALIDQLVAGLRDVPGIAAIVLGGSFARGAARPDSDLDIGLIYHANEPLDVAAVRRIAEELNDSPGPVVSDLGGWGKWVDGGAWLSIHGQRVDLLYRSTALIDQVLADAIDGRFEVDHEQQPPFGFFGPTVLGEVAIARPLHDPADLVMQYKGKVLPVPDALRASVIQHMLWNVEFGLTAFASKYAAAGNVHALAGCLTRFSHALVLTLFALNGAYLLNDKTSLVEAAAFDLAPADFGQRISETLSAIGSHPSNLELARLAFVDLFAETVALAGDSYRPAWRL
jgi:predicted nucleotidyltransferase